MIKVMFFSQLRDEMGQSELSLEEDQLTVAELKDKLKATYTCPTLEAVMTAVNEEYATDETTLQSGDIVAFIPPVSGG